jgi:hypothetical protein
MTPADTSTAAAVQGIGTQGGGNGLVAQTAVGVITGFSSTAGAANTGGGGGGGAFNTASTNRGKAGGSGVVIVRHRF